jgi:hypothetical protein
MWHLATQDPLAFGPDPVTTRLFIDRLSTSRCIPLLRPVTGNPRSESIQPTPLYVPLTRSRIDRNSLDLAFMLYLAAALIFSTGLAHSILGERYILVRLFKRDHLPRLFGGTEFTVGTLRFAWHLTTIAWWSLACLIVPSEATTVHPRDVLRIIGAGSLVSALFPLYFTRGKHLSWIVFVTVGVILFIHANSTSP